MLFRSHKFDVGGENPVSVAFAAVSLAKQIFSDLQRSQALLIGAGETITLVARHLHDLGVKRIVVANRTLERASTLAQQFGAHAVLLSDIPQELVHSDIVISSTASQLPILGKGAVESALKLRKHKPIFMVDIAVPRDIEPEVGELDDVYLYTVDDLHEVVAENLKSRQGAAQAAEEMVSIGAEDFMVRLRELAAVDVLKAYRQPNACCNSLRKRSSLQLSTCSRFSRAWHQTSELRPLDIGNSASGP